jgi:hypothetical protein
MYKVFSIFLFLLLTNFNYGQNANFFADGSRWVYRTTENSEPGQQLVHNTTEQNIIHGDTLIGGLLYHKLYTTLHNELNVYTPPFSQMIHSYDSTGPVFLRYDTLVKKVYYLAGIDSTERLIYDFALQVGDTIPMQSPYFPGAFIDSIDTITVFGVQVKRFFVDIGNSGFDFFNYIVEGMGGTNGLLYFRPEFGSLSGGTFTTLLNCFQFGDSTYFLGNIECPFIDFVSAVRPLDKQASLMISPNPTHDLFTITINQDLLNVTFTLIDCLGRVSQSFKLTELSSTAKLNAPGIYFWRIEDGVRLIKTGRLICN